MTISSFNASTYVADRNTANLVSLKSKLDTLTTQLATGQAAGTYGGLGSARTTSLSAHAALSALDGYDSAITGATTRVSVASAAVTQVGTLGDSVKRALIGTNASTFNTTSQVAANNLDAALDALNQSSAGQYIFGGRATGSAPVVSGDTILNGDAKAGLDGVKALIAERKAADGAVSPGTGTLTVAATSAGTVTLSEAAKAADRANFGFTIGAVSSSNPNAIQKTEIAAVPATVTPSFSSPPKDGDLVRVAINQPDGTQTLVDYTARTTPKAGANEFAIGAGASDAAANLKNALGSATLASAQSATPPGLSLTFTGGAPKSVSLGISATTPPAAGDTVTVTLGLRDGTTTTLTLTATATAPSSGSTTQFQIGATAPDTAKNLQDVLTTALGGSAATTLAASSAALASQDFFAGSKLVAFAARRVDTAKGGFVSDPGAAGAKKTVTWYMGDDTNADPRATATVQASATRTLDIGVQANEAPLRKVLAGMAMVAAETFPAAAAGSSDANRFTAVADRATALLGTTSAPSGVAGLASDLGLAASDLAEAKTQNRTTRAALQTSLDGVDTVSAETVTAQLLQLQTQLQASYQVTSMLSKLSLVNYLG